jgi:hypothetical protein
MYTTSSALLRSWRHWFLLLCAWLLSGTAWAQRGDFQILQATYGTSWQSVDVTERVRQLARNDRFQVTNDNFGVDPAPNQRKSLRIVARDRGGREQAFDFGESQWVDAYQFASAGGQGHQWNNNGGGHGGWGPGGQIARATYGSGRYSVDVTDQVRQIVRQGNGFRVSNDTFGTDPAPNQRKSLRVQLNNGRTVDYSESQWVDASQLASGGGNQGGNQGYYGRLTIHRATYGDGRRQVDITERLRGYVRDGQLEVTASNDLAGRDPAPNMRKVLRIEYSVNNGRRQEAMVEESQFIRLP